MFGSDVIDAAVGLFLVYFLFSVLCSALNEWIVGHMSGLRAKTLEIGIERMLACPNLKKAFFALPLIQSLTSKNEVKPSYISQSTFVDALLTLVQDEARKSPNPPSEATLAEAGRDLDQLHAVVATLEGVKAQPVIQSLLRGAKDMDDARRKLEAWFNEAMDRATGWYRKHAQVWTAFLALGLAIAFNIDSYAIVRELTANAKLRAVLVASAEQTVKLSSAADASGGSSSIAQVEEKIHSLDLPIGWRERTLSVAGGGQPPRTETTWLSPGEGWFIKAGGLLVSAGALSLGAPFWFDLLSKLINLRAAGKRPEVPKDEKKK